MYESTVHIVALLMNVAVVSGNAVTGGDTTPENSVWHYNTIYRNNPILSSIIKTYYCYVLYVFNVLWFGTML